MRVVFTPDAWADYRRWVDDGDSKTVLMLNRLIEDCRRSPFLGLGKPEPLRGQFAGWWSRRITHKDRLVYRVTGTGPTQQVEIAQCHGHY